MIARACGVVAIFWMVHSAAAVAGNGNSEFNDLAKCFEQGKSVYKCITEQSNLKGSSDYNYDVPDSLQNFFSKNAPSSGGTWMKTPADLYLERHGIR